MGSNLIHPLTWDVARQFLSPKFVLTLTEIDRLLPPKIGFSARQVVCPGCAKTENYQFGYFIINQIKYTNGHHLW
jgi:hypothetical protein